MVAIGASDDKRHTDDAPRHPFRNARCVDDAGHHAEKEQQQNRIVAESAAEHGVHGLPEGQPQQHQPQQGGPYDVDEQPAIQNAEKYADDGKPFRSESLRRGNEAEYKHDREHCPCMKIKGWLVRADCEVHP